MVQGWDPRNPRHGFRHRNVKREPSCRLYFMVFPYQRPRAAGQAGIPVPGRFYFRQSFELFDIFEPLVDELPCAWSVRPYLTPAFDIIR